ncbi:hypothetical protein DPMN_107109 [Dreissena polymorpha]|uniref:Uncharacterized protein n=1 Tax=Dreissena polymorpha TaxID=45954 RepID=A0A9D4K696_DREPO|nr:hypothetical protein DPMN_107109 [Dreissena polymorpha]
MWHKGLSVHIRELEKHKLQLQQSPGKTKELQENLKKWIDKCTKLEVTYCPQLLFTICGTGPVLMILGFSDF